MFDPKYIVSASMVTKLSEIAEIKSMVERSVLLPAREAFLRRAAIVKMAHTSTSIEGNRLLENQVKDLAEGKKIRAEADQIKEVENYLVALAQIDRLAKEGNKFTSVEILGIQKKVMSGLTEEKKAGVFRSGPVYVVNVLPKGKEELAYTPPTSERVPGLIEELLTWLKENSGTHPIVRAGLS